MCSFLKFDFILTKITLAIYVEQGHAKLMCDNRVSHGIALNVSQFSKRYIFSDGTEIEIKTNEMIYLPKNSSYRVETVQSGDCFAINFDYQGDAVFSPFRFVPKNVRSYTRQFERAVNMWKQKLSAYRMQCKATLYEILALMQNESESEYLTKKTISLIAPAVEYIHEHYTEDIQIASLASLCGISETYMRKIFQIAYQMSPIKYINQLKMRYAKDLLRTGEYAVGEVARLTGFSDSTYFSREFRRAYGVSPTRYKK